MGQNHGAGGSDSGWFVVAETFASRWHEKELEHFPIIEDRIRS
jgi:hypothetical protein